MPVQVAQQVCSKAHACRDGRSGSICKLHARSARFLTLMHSALFINAFSGACSDYMLSGRVVSSVKVAPSQVSDAKPCQLPRLMIVMAFLAELRRVRHHLARQEVLDRAQSCLAHHTQQWDRRGWLNSHSKMSPQSGSGQTVEA